LLLPIIDMDSLCGQIDISGIIEGRRNPLRPPDPAGRLVRAWYNYEDYVPKESDIIRKRAGNMPEAPRRFKNEYSDCAKGKSDKNRR
jgi:hypothetical protein